MIVIHDRIEDLSLYVQRGDASELVEAGIEDGDSFQFHFDGIAYVSSIISFQSSFSSLGQPWAALIYPIRDGVGARG